MFQKRFTIVYGHYGSGKTNFALNMALDLLKTGKPVTIVDMDIVNPYFRTSDYTAFLKENGIKVIAPAMAGTTLDVPGISPEIYAAFEQTEGYVIVDVGGDDVGAAALGRFAEKIRNTQDYEVLFVINQFRKLIATGDEAAEILREIETSSHLKATAIVNNSHLAHLTTPQDILGSLNYAKEVCEKTGLPLKYTTANRMFAAELSDQIENLYPIEVIVTLPWADHEK